MGCLFRLGCLTLLVIAAVVGWFTRDRWLPEPYRTRFSGTPPAVTWQPLSDAGAARTKEALDRLSQPRGPVFETLSGADVASYAFKQLAQRLPGSADSVEARVVNDRISMRAVVNTSDIRGLGAVGAMLGNREHVELTGTIRVAKPGLGEFQVQEAKIRGLAIPHGMISTLLRSVDRGPKREGVAADAMPLPLPQYVGDIRVANGKITLYKNVK